MLCLQRLKDCFIDIHRLCGIKIFPQQSVIFAVFFSKDHSGNRYTWCTLNSTPDRIVIAVLNHDDQRIDGKRSRRNQWSWYLRLQDGLLWKTDMWRVLCSVLILCDHLWRTTDRSNLLQRTWTEERVRGSPLANLPSSALGEFLLTSSTSRILQCG